MGVSKVTLYRKTTRHLLLFENILFGKRFRSGTNPESPPPKLNIMQHSLFLKSGRHGAVTMIQKEADPN